MPGFDSLERPDAPPPARFVDDPLRLLVRLLVGVAAVLGAIFYLSAGDREQMTPLVLTPFALAVAAGLGTVLGVRLAGALLGIGSLLLLLPNLADGAYLPAGFAALLLLGVVYAWPTFTRRV